MAKKKERPGKNKQTLPPTSFKIEGISNRGWKVIGMGIGIVIVGFYILSLTDPAGQNWASKLSPFLLLGGYAVIGIGIVLPDPSEQTEQKQTTD